MTRQPDTWAILTDTTRCIGCEECVKACQRAQARKSEDKQVKTDVPRRWKQSIDDLSSTRYTTVLRRPGNHFVRQQCRHLTYSDRRRPGSVRLDPQPQKRFLVGLNQVRLGGRQVHGQRYQQPLFAQITGSYRRLKLLVGHPLMGGVCVDNDQALRVDGENVNPV